MAIIFIVHIILLSSSLTSLVNAFSVSNSSCSNSTVHAVRISGCSEQPCTIKKGVSLPFEIDFSFTIPEVSNSVYFNVFIPKYAKPPAAHGSSLVSATCDEGNLGFDCPVNSGSQYTLKSHLLIDSQAVCTGNCENMGDNGTGLRETKWRWAVSDKRKRGEPHRQKSYSSCSFKITLNITE